MEKDRQRKWGIDRGSERKRERERVELNKGRREREM